MEVPIKNTLDLYAVSSNGRIYSYNRDQWNYKFEPKELKPVYRKGYAYVSITYDGDSKFYRKGVHRLVAEAFIPNPENEPCVNHKDGNKLNNRVDNLEWVSYQENNIHAVNTGLRKLKTYKFIHDKYGEFIGTTVDLIKIDPTLNTKILSSITTGKQKSCKGWRMYVTTS